MLNPTFLIDEKYANRKRLKLKRRKFIKIISHISAAGLFFPNKVFGKETMLPVNNKPNPAEWKNDEINIELS